MCRENNGGTTLPQKTILAKDSRKNGLLRDLVQAAKDIVKDGYSLSGV